MRLGGVIGVLALSLLTAASALAQRRTPGYAWNEEGWRFREHDRPVKVVLLAGSIGAFRDRPYSRVLHQWCENAEIRNLSQVGAGAPQLLSRFRRQVLQNRNVPLRAPGTEMWLVFAGGMNSVGVPRRSARAMRSMFELAHRNRMGVIAMTLTPWGTSGDEDERWAGGRGLRALRSTRRMVDFVHGRLSPEEALGSYVNDRVAIGSNAPWADSERPDVVVDLYDSALRDRNASPWPIDRITRELRRDPAYRRSVREVPDEEREARLAADAAELAAAPAWFLKREYRSFDHIHPNRAGHEVMARTICPSLPQSWGCNCPQ
ncbi:MAG: hypothetical protein AB8I08_07465 [Sandaracinaceae bacterium]